MNLIFYQIIAFFILNLKYIVRSKQSEDFVSGWIKSVESAFPKNSHRLLVHPFSVTAPEVFYEEITEKIIPKRLRPVPRKVKKIKRTKVVKTDGKETMELIHAKKRKKRKSHKRKSKKKKGSNNAKGHTRKPVDIIVHIKMKE